MHVRQLAWLDACGSSHGNMGVESDGPCVLDMCCNSSDDAHDVGVHFADVTVGTLVHCRYRMRMMLHWQ